MHIKYSVIIPTLNQSSKLKKCLSQLAKLNFKSDLSEVLVVDNGSTDDTKEVAFSFKDKIQNLNYYFCADPGLMAARHMGCEEAQGDILCYIDDDSFVTKYWLKGISDSFSDKNVVLVGGPCIPEYEIAPPEWLEYFWNKTEFGKVNGFLSLVDFGSQERKISPMYVFGCNFFIRKDIFLEIGGSHPDFFPEKYRKYQGYGESAVAVKLINLGYKAHYNPDVKIKHLVPALRLTVEYFCWRAYYQGIGGSFRKIRKEHGLDGWNKDPKIMKIKDQFLSYKVIQIIKRKLGNVKNTIFYVEPKEIREIREKIRKSWGEGFAFHQRETKNDPKLLEWVLRENYLGENGKLPE